MEPTAHQTALQIARSIAEGESTSEAVVAACLERIAERDGALNAFTHVRDRDAVLAEARAVDAARGGDAILGPLAGVPVAVKDNIAVAGERMTCGSRMLERYASPFSATAVRGLRRAGMIIVGATSLDEFGYGSSNENSAFGPVRNPVDPERVPGGSSGGSAAAVAGGLVPVALGSDTGGSVRQPASLCGAVGFRPTYGRVSRYGLAAYASSMDTIGPITRSAEDALAVLRVIEGADGFDATCVGSATNAELPDRPRIGVIESMFEPPCADAVSDAVRRAAAVAGGAGGGVESVTLTRHDLELAAYYVIASVEAASNLARYDGVRYGHRSQRPGSWEDVIVASRSEAFGAEVKRRVMMGVFTASAGYAEQYYERACRARRLIRDEYLALFERVDVLAAPVSPTTAWPLGAKSRDPVEMYRADVLSVGAALAGLPAVVVPCGCDGAGLPIGVQLTGPPHSDHALLAFASEAESALRTAPV